MTRFRTYDDWKLASPDDERPPEDEPSTAAERRSDLIDLACNVGGLDDRWLVNANEKMLRDLISEWRDAARAAIAKAEGTS
jgi:hypothetical protein